MARSFTVPLLPEGDEAQDLVGLLALAQIGIGVAEDLAGGVLREKGQHRLTSLAAAGNVVLFHDRVRAEVGDGVEVEVERRGTDQALAAELRDPGPQQPYDRLAAQPGGSLLAEAARWARTRNLRARSMPSVSVAEAYDMSARVFEFATRR